MRLEDYDISAPFHATLKASERITEENADEEIRELRFEIEEGDLQFKVGQNIGVLVPGAKEIGHAVHFRLYTIASAPAFDTASGQHRGKREIEICVKRCFYVDDYSGESYPGIASNYLCDLTPGDRVSMAGPFGLAFEVPNDASADLLMIGMGTGIAPFRAFVDHIYRNLGGWQGKLRLFYGARTGLEMAYLNRQRDDFAQYYDQNTFEAFKALSPRPHWHEPAAIDQALVENKQHVWAMLNDPKTHVYIAGLPSIESMLEKAFIEMAGTQQEWNTLKSQLTSSGRWHALIYE